MTLVAGIDSSTQSCKVVIRDLATGSLVRSGRAPHPEGTEVDPSAWWDALLAAIGVNDVIQSAAHDAGKKIRQVVFNAQSPDHPVAWGMENTHYLKFLIVEVSD